MTEGAAARNDDDDDDEGPSSTTRMSIASGTQGTMSAALPTAILDKGVNGQASAFAAKGQASQQQQTTISPSFASSSSSPSAFNSGALSNGLASKHTSPAHQPSPLRNSNRLEFGEPLQVKPLKAPQSPRIYQGALKKKSPPVGGKGSPLSVTRKPLPPEALTEEMASGKQGANGVADAQMATTYPNINRGQPQQALTPASSMHVNHINRTRRGAPSIGASVSPLKSNDQQMASGSHNGLRIRKGQKLEDIQAAQAQPVPSLAHIDSPFQVQEYIAHLIKHDPHNVTRIISLPQSGGEASLAAAAHGGSPTIGFKDKHRSENGNDNGDTFMGADEEPIASVDTDIWVFEQLRRIVLDFTTPWLTLLQRDCDRKQRPGTCEAMNAEEWMYLCASHGEEKQCCAIDYVIHTLDGTTALLNSHRHFPSRTYVPTTSLRHFGSVSRRLSRIFVHAFEHHRDVFEACEAETSLYARFLALVEKYDLIAIDALPKLHRVPASTAKSGDGVGDTDQAPGAQSKSDEKDELRGAVAAADEEDFAPRDGPSFGANRTLFDAGKGEEDDEDGEEEGEIDEQHGSSENNGAEQQSDKTSDEERGRIHEENANASGSLEHSGPREASAEAQSPSAS